MKGAEINLEVPELRQGRVSEPQLGEGTQQSPPPFHSCNLFKMYIYTHASDTDMDTFFMASVRGFKRLNDTITVGESLL